MESKLSCFKAYDVRGKVPDELDEDLAYLIGLAYVSEVQPEGPIAVGIDVRRTSRALADALIRGLNKGGVDVHHIGLCGTEMVYFAASRPGMGGGIRQLPENILPMVGVFGYLSPVRVRLTLRRHR